MNAPLMTSGLCAMVLAATTLSPAHAQVSPDFLSAMTARSIGPAGMSGRIAAIDAPVSDPNVVYVGAATGGLWKSVNGGKTWLFPAVDVIPVLDPLSVRRRTGGG